MTTVASDRGSGVSGCRAAEIFDDPGSAALFDEYVRECANPLMGPAVPDRAMYEAMEQAGFAQCFSVREDGALCGFAFLLIAAVPHHQGRKIATEESLFVSRAARRPGVGLRLMSEIEDHARSAGCREILYLAPVNSRLARLLFLSGDHYINTGHTFYRSLG